RIAKSVAEVNDYIKQMLGATLVTVQTGPAGKHVNRIYIEEGSDIEKEFYLSILVDRETSEVSFVVSTEGGVNIEDVAHSAPEKIVTFSVDPATGWQPWQGRKLAKALGLSGAQATSFAKFMGPLVRCYDEMDCSLLEINPLITTKDGKVLALDAKINFDDNAMYRHPELEEWRDPNEEDPAELEAKKYDLSYIQLDGNIGCMVNGAGLAMSTMDIIKFYGGAPANFLDVGGGATAEKVTAAFKIITSSPTVKAIFVNIFGGIMKCDTIAAGVIQAVKEVGLKVPLVVRLEGTNVELGKKMLAESKLNIVNAADMADGARKVVEAAKGASK
ncbi:MAG TPA: ADP-forming succinate--CoA ligase subunit beta, partial [Kofleriaceae bacterium]|nr:ADP-forming succinate--CoA ligase subunit beta [Kofleriaceae bacterium]